MGIIEVESCDPTKLLPPPEVDPADIDAILASGEPATHPRITAIANLAWRAHALRLDLPITAAPKTSQDACDIAFVITAAHRRRDVIASSGNMDPLDLEEAIIGCTEPYEACSAIDVARRIQRMNSRHKHDFGMGVLAVRMDIILLYEDVRPSGFLDHGGPYQAILERAQNVTARQRIAKIIQQDF